MTTGIHHITAICSQPQPNLDFYTQVLGLRFVKQTVNFDDPSTYHFYYADYQGTPGTNLTFFSWPQLPSNRPGFGQVSRTIYAISHDSLDYWQQRLQSHHIQFETTDNQLNFTDPDGLPLGLRLTADPISTQTFDASTVPADHQLHGFISAQLSLHQLDILHPVLITLGLQKQSDSVYSWQDNPQTLELIQSNQQPQMGTGSVHHIAFTVADLDTQAQLADQLTRQGIAVTPVQDRLYFKSIYFQTPAGILFELATAGPGFDIDEPLDQLGQTLQIPPQWRSYAEPIKKNLPPIVVSSQSA